MNRETLALLAMILSSLSLAAFIVASVALFM